MKRDYERSYEILGRVLTARIEEAGLNRHYILTKTKISESSLKSSLTGIRPFPDENLLKLVQLIKKHDEDEVALLHRIRGINKPGISITHMLRGFRAPLNVGYIDSPPFAFASRRGSKYPDGLLIRLNELFLQLLDVQCNWFQIPLDSVIEFLESRKVDFITGFILEAPSRQTRGLFLPLEMPFAIGINAVSCSPEIAGISTYTKLVKKLTQDRHASGKHLNIITVYGEIADDFFPAIFPNIEPSIRERERNVGETIKYYIKNHPDKHFNIVFADSMSCKRLLPSNAKLVLNDPIGRFQGGFLLPVHDYDWGQYFGRAFHGFLKARLPQVGNIFIDYSQELLEFLKTSDTRILSKKSKGQGISLAEHRREFWNLHEWLQAYWPREIPIPDGFKKHLKKA